MTVVTMMMVTLIMTLITIVNGDDDINDDDGKDSVSCFQVKMSPVCARL